MIQALCYLLMPARQRRAVSFPGLIYAAVIGVIVALAVVLTASRGHGQEIDTQRAALVHVGASEGGSGVCISGDGWILTAAHCVVQETPSQGGWRGKGEPTIVIPKAVKIRFPNQETRSARVAVVWRPDRKTDLALLKVDARGGLPWLPCAKTSPGIGEPVTSIGYPAGHFARFESDIEFVGVTQTTFGPMDLIQATHRGNPGHSGGPLLNLRGEVCGICSMGSVDFLKDGKVERSPQVSLWARCEYFDQLMKEAGAIPTQMVGGSAMRPVIHVWGQVGCEPCKRALDDAKSLRINYQGQSINLYIDLIPHDADQERAEANRQGITTFPTFIIESTGERIEGYPGPAVLNAKIATLLSATVSIMPPGNDGEPQDNQRLPIAAAAPRPRSPPQEAAADDAVPEKVDATGVRVLLIVKKQDLGILAGSALSVVEKFAETGIKKKINTALNGKADVDVVFERSKPKRYSELLEAAGVVEVKRNAVVVILIPKQFTGVAASIAQLIETKLKGLADGDWKYSTILTLAERVDPDGYQAVIEASEQDEVSGVAAGDQSWLTNLWVALTSALAGIGESVLGHRNKKKAVAS